MIAANHSVGGMPTSMQLVIELPRLIESNWSARFLLCARDRHWTEPARRTDPTRVLRTGDDGAAIRPRRKGPSRPQRSHPNGIRTRAATLKGWMAIHPSQRENPDETTVPVDSLAGRVRMGARWAPRRKNLRLALSTTSTSVLCVLAGGPDRRSRDDHRATTPHVAAGAE